MFLAEWRRLADPCNFGQFVTRALRDRFIAGIKDEHIQEKLLTVPNEELTLQRAFQIAESHEAASRNVRDMQTSSGDQVAGVLKVNDVPKSHLQGKERNYGNQAQGGRHQKDCFRCGSDHDPNQCIFRDRNCFHCGRKGHIKVKCHQMRWKSKVKNIDEDDSDDEVHTVVYSVRGAERKISPMLCELEVQGKKVEFEIDTGIWPYTIMAGETVKRTLRNCVLQESKIEIVIYRPSG